MRGNSKLGLVATGSVAALVAWLAASAAAAAPALPGGGHIASGQASISTAGSTLTVDQTSTRAIIDWSSFSIGQGGTVQFDNGSGATLNRVTGGSISSIDGLLSATGSVYLLNPNGVIIGKTGVVNTGGTFAAATQNLTDASFLHGGTLTFSGDSTASVVNLGKVGSLGGDVALIARTVSNSGQISAARGDVGLIAGNQVTLRDRLLDDGKFAVTLGGAGTSVTNSGTIQAAEAELRANGGNIYALAGNTGGVIEATGVSTNDGKVFLVAESGTTVAHGQIDATASDGSGGQVETSGTSVNFDGLSVHAANWLVDPTDLTVDAAAAATISSNLATTSVTLQTTATGASGPGVQNPDGVGDIIIAAPIKWNSSNTLTLDAYHSIDFEAAVTVSGAGKVVLTTNDGGTGGDYAFDLGPSGFGGSLTFTNAPGGGQALTINGAAYTLLYSITDLRNIYSTGLGGDYALANSISAGATTYGEALVGDNSNPFTGIFTGLGHTIAHLTISAPGSGSTDAGLFGGSSGTIRDVGLIKGSISATACPGGGFNCSIGSLVGFNSGTVTDSYSADTVSAVGSGFANYAVGGLVGQNLGAIANAYATGAVSSGAEALATGGLVGEAFGPITNAYATGVVSSGASSSYTGGLVGLAEWSISNSYASGAISSGAGSSNVGGLVGGAMGASITNSFYNIDKVLINGNQAVTVGGIYNTQYQDWFSHGFSLNIANYFGTPDSNGFYSVGDLADLENVLGFAESPGAKFKLTSDIDLSSATGFFIPYFAGVLDGQGHVISNLSLDVNNSDLGMVGLLTATGSISNLGVVGDSVSGLDNVGGLVGGDENGPITNSFASGTVSGEFEVGGLVGEVGGLIGDAGGAISNSHAAGSVSGDQEVGGLAGAAESISNSYATATVQGLGNFNGRAFDVGGLVGEEDGAITNAYATGAVNAVGDSIAIGGLVGENFGGSITGSYASGAVNDGAYALEVGGLVGENFGGGTISTSFATGAVSVGADAWEVGGLVGANEGAITNTYATGAVSAGTGSTKLGGLVGLNESGAAITSSYATGLVLGPRIDGLVGANHGGTITDGYYDADTTGRPLGTQADGSVGLTTAELQGALPAGFSSSVWGTGAGLYPYLVSFYPTAPQAISGYAYNSNGSAAKGAQIGVYDGGALLSSGDASSGANGYFYELVAGGAVASTDRLGETIEASGSTSLTGLAYTDQLLTLTSGNVTGLSLTSGTVAETTAETSLSALNADLAAAFGSAYAGIAAQLTGASRAITATSASGFTIDQSLTSGGNIAVTTSGDLTIAGTVDAAGKLTLTSAGDIDASGGSVEAATLLGASAGGAAFTGAGNLVGTLGKFVNTGSGAFSLTNAEALRLTGPLTDTVGAVTLVTTTGALNLAGTIDAAGQTLTLTSAGAISAAPATLRAATLDGSWTGGAVLTGAGNRFNFLGGFTNNGTGSLNLVDGIALKVTGTVTDTTGNVTLATTAGDLTVTGTIDAAGRTVTLTSAGAIDTTGATLVDKKLVENPNTP